MKQKKKNYYLKKPVFISFYKTINMTIYIIFKLDTKC